MRRGDDSTQPGRPEKPGDDRRSAGGPANAPSSSPATTTYVFSRDAIRRLDKLAVEEFGIPSIVLMENAAVGLATGVAEFLEDLRDASTPGTVLVFAGRGNNGGDGLAAARHLHNEGRRVALVLAAQPDQYEGDAATNLRIVEAMGIPRFVAAPPDPLRAVADALNELGGVADVIIDALLGTGAHGPVTGPYAALIAEINRLREAGSAVVAADLPSGLDADTGAGLCRDGGGDAAREAPLGDPGTGKGGGANPAVRADLTVTFVGLKEGFLTLTAQEFLGEVVVAPIGAPTELACRLGRPVEVSEYPGERPGEPGRGRSKPPPPAPRTH